MKVLDDEKSDSQSRSIFSYILVKFHCNTPLKAVANVGSRRL